MKLSSDFLNDSQRARIIFNDPAFFSVIRNTILISVYRLVFGFSTPIIVALLLNEIRNVAFKRVTQTFLYLPHFISWVIVGSIIKQFLAVKFGVFNNIITFMGGDAVPFLLKKEYFRTIIVASAIWKNAGFSSIIYLAALTGVNPELYEAAWSDGAGKLRQLWHITLPGIRPTIIVMFILALSRILNYGFDQVWVLMNPVVQPVGE